MKVLKTDLEHAVQKEIITADQAAQLWTHFEKLRPDQTRFQTLHVLYYFGGVLILASMSWLLTTAWSNGIALMAIAAFFAIAYIIVGRALWTKHNLKIPGGLLITAAVGLTPVFVYGLQKATHFWPIYGGWLFIELSTVVSAILALRFFPFTFITFPLAISLWCLSMDLIPALFGVSQFDSKEQKFISCGFGLLMLIASYYIDRKFKKIDFAFWTYLYGVVAFWTGISLMDSNSELMKLFYCLFNLLLIVVSVYLRRKVFLVFGTIGVSWYLSHLAWRVFKDSYTLPIALTFAGLGIVWLGVMYQKNRRQFESAIEKILPTLLMKWRPEERA